MPCLLGKDPPFYSISGIEEGGEINVMIPLVVIVPEFSASTLVIVKSEETTLNVEPVPLERKYPSLLATLFSKERVEDALRGEVVLTAK